MVKVYYLECEADQKRLANQLCTQVFSVLHAKLEYPAAVIVIQRKSVLEITPIDPKSLIDASHKLALKLQNQ